MRASDVTTLTVRMGAHNLKESAREAGVQNHGVKLVVKHKDFTMETLVSLLKIRDLFFVFRENHGEELVVQHKYFTMEASVLTLRHPSCPPHNFIKKTKYHKFFMNFREFSTN